MPVTPPDLTLEVPEKPTSGKSAPLDDLVPSFVNETTRLSKLCSEATRGLIQAEEKLSLLSVSLALANFGVLAIQGPHQELVPVGSLDIEE